MSSEIENKVVNFFVVIFLQNILQLIILFYQVHLGSGFYCTNAGFAAMKAAKNYCDWAAALLVGVFGEDAKLMRIYPRKEGLKKFPLGFLMLAQSKYSIVMKEIGVGVFFLLLSLL